MHSSALESASPSEARQPHSLRSAAKTVAARCRALQSCRTRLTLDVWVLLSGGRAVVMLDYCLGLQLRDCLALAAAVNRAVAGQAGSDLLVTLTQEGCCYLALTTLLCQHLQRLTQGGPRPLLLHFPPPQAAAGSLQPQLLPAAAAQVLLAGLSSLVQALQPDLPQHTPAPSLAHALPTTGPASTQLPPTSCTALDLGALPDLPPMPTLNGLLLGYPCVYVVEGSREQAQQAASTLSCTPLALLKLLAPPPQQLMQAMQAMQARVGGWGPWENPAASLLGRNRKKGGGGRGGGGSQHGPGGPDQGGREGTSLHVLSACTVPVDLMSLGQAMQGQELLQQQQDIQLLAATWAQDMSAALDMVPAPRVAQRVRGLRRQQEVSRSVRVHFFRFGKNGVDAEGAGIVGSQGRDDYNYDDVEQYFNYMGFLAEEGTYDRMEALLASGLHPIDIILILACSENDTPKIGEILRAGADVRAKGLDGRTPLQIATKPEVLSLLKEYEAKAAAKA
ncbi:hypothetical protein QJQ45_004693 [Haematococcus lacustris]|nr:hypothetical protein QJQ45_004693 [Haematococcus lacustris]